MARAIPLTIRKQIICDYNKGLTYKVLATKYGISSRSIGKFCRLYRLEGEKGLQNQYKNCGNTEIQFEDIVYRSICWLKYLHRDWGAISIINLVALRYGDKYLYPSERTAQLWFQSKGYQPIKLNHKMPRFETQKARYVHDIWQIDAKEKTKIGDDSYVCWLTITDEKSCGVLDAPVFSP